MRSDSPSKRSMEERGAALARLGRNHGIINIPTGDKKKQVDKTYEKINIRERGLFGPSRTILTLERESAREGLRRLEYLFRRKLHQIVLISD